MERIFKAISVVQLQCILKQRGLNVNGKKADLMKALYASLVDCGESPGLFLENFFKTAEEDETTDAEDSNSGLVVPSGGDSDHVMPSNDNDMPGDIFSLTSALNMPSLTLQSFSGDPTDYPRFMGQFSELIIKSSMSETQKLSRLVQFLEGDAKDSVKYFQGVPGGLDRALKVLKSRYGEPYLIVHSTLESITNIKQLNEFDKVSLRKYSDRLNCAYYTLKSLCQLSEVNTSHMLKIVKKLTVGDQNKWRNIVANTRPKSPNFKQLVEFVEKRSNAANDPVFGIVGYRKEDKSHCSSSKHLHVHSTAADIRSSHAITSCAKCKEVHKLMHCTEFVSLDVPRRRAFVKTEKLCFNCLGRNHCVKDCRSKVRCLVKKCGKNHHTLLHENTLPSTNVSQYCASVERSVSIKKHIVPDADVKNLSVSRQDSCFLQIGPVRVLVEVPHIKTRLRYLILVAKHHSFHRSLLKL